MFDGIYIAIGDPEFLQNEVRCSIKKESKRPNPVRKLISGLNKGTPFFIVTLW